MGATVYPQWIPIGMTVDPGHDGYRLDRFLKARIARLSRTKIQTIIALGQLRHATSGETLTRPSVRVRAGDDLILLRPAPKEPPVVLDFETLHRDEALLVIDKPAGLPVHPSARYHRHTLTALMRERFGPDHGWEMAHRIDRETSGVMVFGRSGPRRRRRDPPSPAGYLKRAFQQREVTKEYLALVRGDLADACTIDIPLGLDPRSRLKIKMAAMPGGLEARTDVQPLRGGRFRGEPITLVRCRPHTGRQHQIRIHLALVDHPILGDKLYGLNEELFIAVADGTMSMHELDTLLGLPRHALHAHRITIPHPATGVPATFTAPWPLDSVMSASA